MQIILSRLICDEFVSLFWPIVVPSLGEPVYQSEPAESSGDSFISQMNGAWDTARMKKSTRRSPHNETPNEREKPLNVT